MAAITVDEAVARFGVEVLDHLDRQVAVPVLSGAQCQGDVSVLPVAGEPAVTALRAAGVPVVRGEAGGNTHSLHGDGPGVCFDAAPEGGLALGVLTVPEGSAAYLAHPEHGYLGVGPGTYRVGRQREWASEWRLVAD